MLGDIVRHGGTVWLTVHRERGSDVCLKIPEEQSGETEDIQRLEWGGAGSTPYRQQVSGKKKGNKGLY